MVLRGLCGHGIGRRLHEAPDVPNWGDPNATSVLHEGIVFALEPMLSAGDSEYQEAADGWTLVTKTGTLAVHEEHTIMVRRGVPLVLTAA